MTWKCHICGEERPDECISVRSTDISETYGLPEGTITQNVRHCNDNGSCIQKSYTKRLVTKPMKGGAGNGIDT